MLHTIFVVFKFFFGLGALATLLGVGAGLVWFSLHFLVRVGLRHQPSDRFPLLRQLFLESTALSNRA